jgi:hypothetical protein
MLDDEDDGDATPVGDRPALTEQSQSPQH